LKLLEGKLVNLRVVEKEDLSLAAEWLNNPEYFGVYNPLMQTSRAELEKRYDNLPPEERSFIIEKKDGSKIGAIFHSPVGKQFEIGYALIPSERGKGYCTEAVKIMADYLFLSKDTVRIQAHIDPRNIASQKVVERNGFKKEGTIRKCFFAKGEWRDMILFSILREEWKEPKILTKTVPKS
jgi:ribosomal-protein-alanine N-acetyltransferase